VLLGLAGLGLAGLAELAGGLLAGGDEPPPHPAISAVRKANARSSANHFLFIFLSSFNLTNGL